jgi:hypothetical protein
VGVISITRASAGAITLLSAHIEIWRERTISADIQTCIDWDGTSVNINIMSLGKEVAVVAVSNVDIISLDV